MYYWFEEKCPLLNALKIPAINDPMSSRVCLDAAALSVNQVNQKYLECNLTKRWGLRIQSLLFVKISDPFVIKNNKNLPATTWPANFSLVSSKMAAQFSSSKIRPHVPSLFFSSLRARLIIAVIWGLRLPNKSSSAVRSLKVSKTFGGSALIGTWTEKSGKMVLKSHFFQKFTILYSCHYNLCFFSTHCFCFEEWCG